VDVFRFLVHLLGHGCVFPHDHAKQGPVPSVKVSTVPLRAFPGIREFMDQDRRIALYGNRSTRITDDDLYPKAP
jgi:hypothetical protein